MKGKVSGYGGLCCGPELFRLLLGACLWLALLSEVLAVFSRPFGTYPFAIGTQHSVLG
jgi:hypothetical protein